MLQSPEPLVKLNDAGMERAGRWLVRGVDLAVGPGELVTLIGPNGSMPVIDPNSRPPDLAVIPVPGQGLPD